MGKRVGGRGGEREKEAQWSFILINFFFYLFQFIDTSHNI